MFQLNSLSKKYSPQYDNKVNFSSSLEIETHILGYQTQGESILFFIYADSHIFFSGLVDCYKSKECNLVKDILDNHKVQNLDFICWTHPDSDHSEGLSEIIEAYTTEKTLIFIPEGVDQHSSDCSEKAQSLFNYLVSSLKEPAEHINVYSAACGTDMLINNSFCFFRGTSEYPLYINAFSPDSAYIRNQFYYGKFERNEQSIFLLIKIGDIFIALTGDLGNDAINRLPTVVRDLPLHICKIPHHGSSTSDCFPDIVINSCDIACSTVYRIGKCNLPDYSVLETYKNKTEYLFCTGKKDKKQEKDLYGSLSIRTNILECTCEIVAEGNVEKLK